MPELTKPTVHLNGTGASDLTEGYLEASRAISNAMDMLSCSQPNGRDYYPQGDAALNAAIAEHRARQAKLKQVQDELDALAEHCSQFIKNH